MEKLFSLLLPHRRPPAWWHQNPPLESPGFLRSAADWPTDWTRLPCPSASGRSYSWRGWYSSGSLCRGWWAWLAWCWCTAWPSSPQMSRNLKVECVLLRIVKISLTIIKKKGSFVYYYYHHFIWGCVLLTNLEIWGNLLHFCHEVSPKVLDIFQIVFHGEGEVHKVIQVDGVVLSTLEFQVKSLGLTLRTKITIFSGI